MNKSKVVYRIATQLDVDVISDLEQQYQSDELNQQELAQSLQAQCFTVEQLTMLLNEQGLWVAEDDNNIVGYLIAGSWAFFQCSALCCAFMKAGEQHKLSQKPDWNNSLHYGPVWVHPAYRGQRILANLYDVVKKARAVTWFALIAEDNTASLTAHHRDQRMQTIDYITLCDRDFYVLKG